MGCALARGPPTLVPVLGRVVLNVTTTAEPSKFMGLVVVVVVSVCVCSSANFARLSRDSTVAI